MCVIAVSEKTRPSDGQVERMWNANRHGAGVAWREVNNEGVPHVRWIKGIDSYQEVQKLVARLPQPFVVHFRVPSVGGPHPLLTHPFPISPDSWLDREGMTTEAVLFHNGTLHRWKEKMWETCMAMLESGRDVKVPGGKWSDSRAMAWMAGVMGIGICQSFDEKIIAFGPTDLDAYGDWNAIQEGLWVSNTYWEGGGTYTGRGGNGGVHRSHSASMHDGSVDEDDDEGVKNVHTRPTQGSERKALPAHTGTTSVVTGTSSGTSGSAASTGGSEVSPDQHPFRCGTQSIHDLHQRRTAGGEQEEAEAGSQGHGSPSRTTGGDSPSEEGSGSGEAGADRSLDLLREDGTLTQLGDHYLWAKSINEKKFSSSGKSGEEPKDARMEVICLSRRERELINLARIGEKVCGFIKPTDERTRRKADAEKGITYAGKL